MMSKEQMAEEFLNNSERNSMPSGYSSLNLLKGLIRIFEMDGFINYFFVTPFYTFERTVDVD